MLNWDTRRETPGRDYIGYGPNPPSVQWPNGARLALNFVINYESGSERSFAAGDNRNESVGEMPRSVDPATRDLALESVYEYDSRAGVYRLFRLFDRFNVKCTVFAAAMALEVNPYVGRWIGEGGHEACGHGWRWEEPSQYSREEERSRILRAVDSFEKTTGQRPVGWLSRWNPSPHTRELLVEEGGFIYDSDAYNDDLPYYVDVHGKSFLILPYTAVHNDARFFFGGYSSPTDFLDYCIRGLDYLWEEGASVPRMMSIGIHGRWAGQPSRASALREFIEYAREKGDVWFARRCDIARWWLDAAPASSI
jgi:peptidoglycan/xylan/chitin deacetylase (PgdA/CDA1 family)